MCKNLALARGRDALVQVYSLRKMFLYINAISTQVHHKLLVMHFIYYSLFVVKLNKSTALVLLHELYNSINESRSKSHLSANDIQVSHIFTGGYEINLKVKLDDYSRAIINKLIKKDNLYMKEGSSQVTLRSLGD